MNKQQLEDKTLDFISKYTGQLVDWDGAYGGQCVDLARQYWHEVMGITPQPNGVVGAADFWNNFDQDPQLPKYYTKVKNTADLVVEVGDIPIWNKRVGGGYGHIGVGIQGTLNDFISFDQNWPPGSKCVRVSHSYSNLYGVLRPKLDPDPEPEPPTNEVETLPKDSVIGDVCEGLTGERNQSDIDFRMQEGKNIKQIVEEICIGDERFYNKWVKPHVDNVKKQYENSATIPVINEQPISKSGWQTIRVSANEGGESMATETKYPEWKKAAIEGARTFATVFVSTVLVQLGAGVDFSQWRVWLVPMLLAGASAGFKALGKYIRDTYGQQDYSSLIYKITP